MPASWARFSPPCGRFFGWIAPYVTGALMWAIKLLAALLALLAELGAVAGRWLAERSRALASATARGVERHVTPLSTVAFVGIAAAVGLGVSQFFDYHGVAVDASNYAGEVGSTAPAPIVGTESAGSAHLWVLIPIAVVAVVLIVATYRGQTRFAPAVFLCGLLGLAVALAIDLPQGLDAGRPGLAFSGSRGGAAAGILGRGRVLRGPDALRWPARPLLSRSARGDERRLEASRRAQASEPRGRRDLTRPADRLMRGRPRTETLLVLACAAAAAMLGVSQFIDIFHLTPPGGEALKAIQASDQHGYATLVLAIFALILLVIAIVARGEQLGQVAAVAIAVCGLVALLIFLIGDLPKVNNVGTLDDPRQSFIDAKAKPVAGFWLELVGALVLTVCGAALATMRPDRTGTTEQHGGRSHESAVAETATTHMERTRGD